MVKCLADKSHVRVSNPHSVADSTRAWVRWSRSLGHDRGNNNTSFLFSPTHTSYLHVIPFPNSGSKRVMFYENSPLVLIPLKVKRPAMAFLHSIGWIFTRFARIGGLNGNVASSSGSSTTLLNSCDRKTNFLEKKAGVDRAQFHGTAYSRDYIRNPTSKTHLRHFWKPSCFSAFGIFYVLHVDTRFLATSRRNDSDRKITLKNSIRCCKLLIN